MKKLVKNNNEAGKLAVDKRNKSIVPMHSIGQANLPVTVPIPLQKIIPKLNL